MYSVSSKTVLLDRIDIHVPVRQVCFNSEKSNETSSIIRERVIAAREKQKKKFYFFFGIYFFTNKKTMFKYKKQDLKLDWKVNMQAIKIAMPYFCVQVSTSVYTIIINHILDPLGYEMGLSVYAILSGYIIYILNMFVTSLSTGTTPIIAYNLGEKLFARLRGLLNRSIVVNVLTVGVVTLLFEVFAEPVCVLFCGPGELAEAGAVTVVQTAEALETFILKH